MLCIFKKYITLVAVLILLGAATSCSSQPVEQPEPVVLIEQEYVTEPCDLTHIPEDQLQIMLALYEDYTKPAGKYNVLALTEEECMLVALTAYHEARGEGLEGMKAVIEVIFNRMLAERWPNTAKDVIYAPGQFRVASYLLTANINEPELLTQAFNLVREVLDSTEYILPDGYVYFATSKVNGKDFIKIGNHYFSK